MFILNFVSDYFKYLEILLQYFTVQFLTELSTCDFFSVFLMIHLVIFLVLNKKKQTNTDITYNLFNDCYTLSRKYRKNYHILIGQTVPPFFMIGQNRDKSPPRYLYCHVTVRIHSHSFARNKLRLQNMLFLLINIFLYIPVQ